MEGKCVSISCPSNALFLARSCRHQYGKAIIVYVEGELLNLIYDSNLSDFNGSRASYKSYDGRIRKIILYRRRRWLCAAREREA